MDDRSGPALANGIEPLGYQQQDQKKRDLQAEMDEAIDGFEKELKEAKDIAKAASPGTTNLLIRGFAAASYIDSAHADSTFGAVFQPIFLWRLSDRIFFEGAPEFEIAGQGEIGVGLEFAQLSYILNDCMTIGVGKFLSPFGIFPERLDPEWINKLPAKPLVFDDGGIAPSSEVGIQARGVIPLWCGKLNYAVYLSNGPSLNLGDEDPAEAGKLGFENFEDLNHGKAFGTRIGYQFNPEWEVGYSLQVARVGPGDTPFYKIDAVLQGMDVSWIKDSECLKGRIDTRFEWVWSDVNDTTYLLQLADPPLPPTPVNFTNDRNGGYVQVAYRPLKADCECLRAFESVVRFDSLTAPSHAPGQFSEQRWTLGFNYWLGPSTLIKVAYQFDNRNRGEKDEDAFLLQAVVGF